jgi:hypothetical protein
MALTDIKELPSRRLFPRMRIKRWLAGEHAVTQRMAGTAFAIRVASAVIVFLSQVLLARWMGDSEFGTYVYVWTWLMLVGELVHLGMPLTAQKFIPQYTHAGAFDLLRGYLAGSRWITFGIGTVAALVGALIVHAVEDRLDSHMIMPFYLACVALPFYASTFMFDALARSYNWINVALLPPFVVRPLLLVAGVAAARAAGIEVLVTDHHLAGRELPPANVIVNPNLPGSTFGSRAPRLTTRGFGSTRRFPSCWSGACTPCSLRPT